MDIIERLRFDAARCEQQFSKGVAGNIEEAAAEIERLRAALEDARHYAAVCPPPPELTGGPRMEMLARRHRIGMAGAHEQRGTGQ